MSEETSSRAEHETRDRSNDPVDGSDRAERTPPTDDSAPLERRDYLRSIGALGVAGVLGGLGLGGGATGGAAAAQADTSKSVQERIEEHRTGTLEVVVENADGSAVSNADVTVEQQSHDFRWGTAVNAGTLINESSPGDNYRTYIPELFNTAVMENRHKWSFWENEQQLADEATDWLIDQGLDVRGHVCIWGDRSAGAVPSDIETAIDNNDTQTIRDRSMQHIEDIMNHYADQIHEWEVVNEVQHATDIFDPFTSNPATSQIVVDWYQQAQDVRPEGVTLGVNDYSVLAGNYNSDISTYQSHIQHLLDNGIDLQTTGLQCHFGQNETLGTNTVIDLLNEYGQMTDSIKITEFDMSDDNWSGNAKADFFEEFLRATFSHPGVDAFLMWGFWDGRHWQDDAPLFDQNWNPKPAYDVWMDLVYGEWWTDESGTTDSSGTYTTNAFLGEHEITVTTDEGSTTTTVSVTDADGTTTVSVSADTGNGNGSEEPPAIDGNQPADTTGDGLYNDLDGSGSTTTTDVNVFFEHVDDPAVADYPEYYDFDGNGDVSISDVVELFDSL